ncbi:MAG: antitoxin, partial [Deltaproteobacteria bacterium CG_4_8_14_3_um_filter_43_13]
MNIYELIESRPDVMRGKPVIRGTRIPVELIVRKMGEGASIE